MRYNIHHFYIAFFLSAFIFTCANRGNPSGGEKDETPPKIESFAPDNYSVNFDENEIRIYFDEYIKLKDLKKQLIISPPMNIEPTISPLGGAKRFIKIKLLDTLKTNTTYTINFGNSIVDNNEENPFPYFRYVFSTGKTIDSLFAKGKITNADKRITDNFVSVMLYEVDSTYTDSIIFKQKPKFITNTLDSLTQFTIENVKAGTYKLIALKEENPNYTFQPKSDKIGFVEQLIELPKDSAKILHLKLFKEALNYKVLNAKQKFTSSFKIGFKGKADSAKIEFLDLNIPDFTYRAIKKADEDSLSVWYTPAIKQDSVFIRVKNHKKNDTILHYIRPAKKDSLVITPLVNGTLHFGENFGIEANIPLTKIDTSLISLINKDSLKVPFKTILHKKSNQLKFHFEPKEKSNYYIKLFPGALINILNITNDTLNYRVNTREYADYGSLTLHLKQAKFPIIAEIVNENDEVKYQKYVTSNQAIDFKYISPGKYYIRIVLDENKNSLWDSGNFLNKTQPEPIIYIPSMIEIFANFENVETFTLQER